MLVHSGGEALRSRIGRGRHRLSFWRHPWLITVADDGL